MYVLLSVDEKIMLIVRSMFFLAPLHGFAFWFDVEFNGPIRQKSKKQSSQSSDGNTQNASPSSKKKKPDVSIVLSTAPEDAPTHWQQVIVFHGSILIFFCIKICVCLYWNFYTCFKYPQYWLGIVFHQTLLYLFEPIELNKDQIIEGCVTITQSQQHARFLNICLKYLWAFLFLFISAHMCLVNFNLE